MPKPWTQEAAIELCRRIEDIAPLYGCHVALTGGCLYKPGERKDCDLLFYRIRQVETINVDGLIGALIAKLGMQNHSGFGWCHKLELADGRKCDLFFPEQGRVQDSAKDDHWATEYDE